MGPFPAGSDAALQSEIETCFTALTRRVARRQSIAGEMTWLYRSDNRLPVVPDYLAFDAVGRSGFERLVNRGLSRLSRRLWYRAFWPKIRRGLRHYITQTYLPRFFSNMPAGAENDILRKGALSAVEDILGRDWRDLPSCTFVEFGTFVTELIHACRKQLGGEEDVFREEKRWQNRAALAMVQRRFDPLSVHPKLLDILLYCACQSNRIDSLEAGVGGFMETFEAECGGFLTDTSILDRNRYENPYYHIDRFESLIASPSKVFLYESDNCGEIVFDLLLIQHLLALGHRVVLGVKARPVLNDATVADVDALLPAAIFSGLRRAVREQRLELLPIDAVIGGKLPYEVSETYRQAYRRADALILKGQANFQTMPMGVKARGRFFPYRYRKPLVFLMVVKSLMAELSLGMIMNPAPAHQSMFLYCYDAEDEATYPMAAA